MTILKRDAICGRAIPAAALAALLLAGCSSGHVGEDWQCPLAAGGSCASVAAADPAAPDVRKTGTPVLAGPLWLVPRGNRTAGADAPPARGPGQAPTDTRPCATECGFDPFAWLARLLGADAGNDGTQPAETVPATRSAIEEPDAAASPSAREKEAGSRPEEPVTAALPAEAPSAGDGPDGATLRTGEAVARIWIAPFVDANGVYREAAWVRAVLAPAGWRLR